MRAEEVNPPPGGTSSQRGSAAIRLLRSPSLALAWSGLVGLARTVMPPPTVPALDHPERILVVKLDRIGDMVLTSPFLRELRRAFPRAWITLVAGEALRPLLCECPYVSEQFYLKPEATGLRATFRRWADNTRLAWTHLRARRFTHALLPRYGCDHYLGYHLVTLSGARERIGFSEKTDAMKAKENRGCDRLLTTVLPPVGTGHEVERMLVIIAALGRTPTAGRLEVWLAPAAREIAARTAAPWKDRTLIGVCAASQELVRDWPFERFRELFGRFTTNAKVQFLLLGGPELKWVETGLDWSTLPHVKIFAGSLRLDETAALIGHCDIFLSVDTGLMHIAAAQQVPIVEITSQPRDGDPQHHQSPARFGPWGVPHRIVAPANGQRMPANRRLIDLITVDEVIAALCELTPALR